MNAIHILKPGAFTDSSGQEVSFTFKDLRQCAASYDVALHEAPLVVGHPTHDAPAWGWVSSLKVTDAGLEAVPTQLDPAFAEAHRAGRYKKVSASLYRPDSPTNPKPGAWYLRHVGFLGAQPPAVKGLAQVALADGDADILFTEIDLPPAEQDMNKRVNLEETGAPQKTEAEALQEGLDAAKHENEALKAELERLRKEIADREAEQAEKEATDFAEGLAKEGKINQADAALVASLYKMSRKSSVSFGETSAHDALKAFLASRPAVDLSEFATGDKAPAGKGGSPREAHHQRALAYAAKHGCSYTDAARATISS